MQMITNMPWMQGHDPLDPCRVDRAIYGLYQFADARQAIRLRMLCLLLLLMGMTTRLFTPASLFGRPTGCLLLICNNDQHERTMCAGGGGR